MERIKAVIKRIDWLDQETREADVCFEVGKGSYWAFCHPCDFTEGEAVCVGIDFVDIEDVTFETMFSYNVGVNPLVVDCGDLRLDLGALTHDDRVVGSYVYFVISRLDVVAV